MIFALAVGNYYSQPYQALFEITGCQEDCNINQITHSLTVFAHTAGPLSQNNPGATTEVAMVWMIHGHLKYYCQAHSNTIQNNQLVNIAKGLENPCRVYKEKYSLHRFSMFS